MTRRDIVETFEEARPRLLGLAYRILGSRADAEDVVQDTFLKWQQADTNIDNPAAWLTTACTRRCLDVLKAGHRKRVDYVGAWLPEPIHTAAPENVEEQLALSSSLTTAFMLMLERLSPKERAAYLLYEIFERPYAEVAETLDLAVPAARKLVSRAKTNIGDSKVRYVTPPERQDTLLSAFHAAIHGGNVAGLSALLSDEVRLTADSGGKVPAALGTVDGYRAVMDFIAGPLAQFWADYGWGTAMINGEQGIVLTAHGETVAVVSFGYGGDGRVTDIFVMRNPEKLTRLDAPRIA
jgi:RNA polymerase sigma-70 factor (ECF subfamily)